MANSNISRLWTPEDVTLLKQWYAERSASYDFGLDELARRLGRLKSNVSRKARSLGLTNLRRRKVEKRKPRPANKFSDDEERRSAVGERIKKYIQEHGHPRGALGMKHTDETRAVLSQKSKAQWLDPNSRVNSQATKQRKSDFMVERNRILKQASSNPYSRAAHGRREDLDNRYFRSSWEANYARYLNFLKTRGEIKGWDYECKTFYFETIKRGTRSYTPDFKILLNNGQHEWHEVKGWMDAKSQTRLNRMAKYFPDEKLIVIDAAWFRQASRSGLTGVIPHWEFKPQRNK